MSDPRTDVLDDAKSLAVHAAQWIANLIEAREGRRFRLALTGGSTPRPLYCELASRYRDAIDWKEVEFYWSDERFVPHDSPASNFQLAQETLLQHIPVPPENIHAIPVEGSPADAAHAYEDILKRIYGAQKLDPARPFFDLSILGLGPDGHICSLVPGSPVLDEKSRWAAEVLQGKPEFRITLTYPCVQSSRMTAFYVTGQDKAEAVRGARAHDPKLPAGRLQPDGGLVWLLDRAAATLS
ncbi:MAG: 6-phosphogluconolactonase [Alphaproteobacteria bacterium]|nr:6-phosphogluconolactonase [Alphaproteobacteria bacterium]